MGLELVENKKKLIHIELIRVLAALLVIFNHTGLNGFFLFSSKPFATMPYFFYMTFAVICKIDVPLFLMISGAVLLKKDLESKKIIIKILRMILILTIFSAFFYIRLHLLNYSKVFSFGDFFIRLYKGDIIIPYWYIYAYISFLLAFPFLRAMIKSLPDYGYKYLICLAIIFIGIIPYIQYRFFKGKVVLNQYGTVSWLLTNIVLFPIIGYYLENKIDISKINKKHIFISLAISFLLVLVSCYMTYIKHRTTGVCNENKTQDFLDVFSLPICISVYLSIKYLCNEISFPNWLNKSILSIGSCCFGIYLIHMSILESKLMNNLLTFLTKDIMLNYMLSIWLICILTLIISYTIIFIIKLIPYAKKIL